ncbi:MAG: hypothetical protein KDI17_09010 [Halioglobus sp.]|nr:hypothetical protein [Halioglobus sp.]
METLFTLLALALPVLLGGLWLNLLIPQQTAARAALVWGNGTLLGLLLIPQFLWGLDALGLPLSFATTGALTGVLIAVAITLQGHRHTGPAVAPARAAGFSAMPASHRALFLLLLLLLAVRCVTLGLEILWRPLFPWDATMHWATKARVWFEFAEMVPFVDNHAWLQMGGSGVFTDRHPDYPHTIPLLQVWMNLAVGHWNESLMNLPWLLCLVAMGGAFFGQLRVAGVAPLTAMGFTYLLLSMPLVNIHVALAGYADLFLGATYCAGLMAFHNWLTTRSRAQGVLAVVFALGCLLVKNEGLPWALTFIPALLLAPRTRHKLAKLALLVSLGLAFLFILMQKNPIIIKEILQLVTEFHPDGLNGTIRAVWLHDNFHLLGYLLLAILPMGFTIPGAFSRKYQGISVALACAVLMFLFLFLFTVFGAGASNFTGVGRLCIQLAPGLLFLCALLVNDLLVSGRAGRAPAATAN